MKVKKDNKDNGDQEIKERLARALADYDNLVKRFNKEREEVILRANRSLVEDLLPTLDNLERAQDHIKDQGLEMAIGQLRQTLERHGVQIIFVEAGDSFNEQIHEVVDVAEGGEEGKIAQVLTKGYKWSDGAVVRPAKVRVYEKEEEKQNE